MQFTIYRNKGNARAYPYLLDVQSDIIGELATSGAVSGRDVASIISSVYAAPLIDLDPAHYKTVAKFDTRFPAGAPSLRRAQRLTVRGDWTFGRDVTVVGDGDLEDSGQPGEVAAGTILGE